MAWYNTEEQWSLWQCGCDFMQQNYILWHECCVHCYSWWHSMLHWRESVAWGSSEKRRSKTWCVRSHDAQHYRPQEDIEIWTNTDNCRTVQTRRRKLKEGDEYEGYIYECGNFLNILDAHVTKIVKKCVLNFRMFLSKDDVLTVCVFLSIY